MTNKEIALKILKLVGGESNISNVTHCATRLRLVLKDDKKVNLQQLNMVEGVLKAQNSGGQLQVVLGGKVEKVYDEFVKEANITSISLDSTSSVKKNPFNTFLETIAGVFTPILPALVGCGMMKCLSSILTASGFVNAQSGFILIFNMIADCVFYFMPFFLAVSAAKKFKTNEYLAIALAACLLHPTILTAASNIATTGVSTINFLGLPILLVKYTSTVIPIILSVWVMSYVYRFIDKFIPEMLKVILVPMLVLLVMVPLTLIAIGPFGSYVGTWLSNIISLLFTANGIIAGFVLGFFRPILVMFGMHYSIMPMQIQQIAEQGYTAMLPSALAANMAQAGAVFAVFVIIKNKTMKAAAGSSSITAIFGVTEPAIYGVNLKYKKPFFAGCLAAGIVGGFFGLVNASGTAIAIPGILSLGTYQANSFIFIIIGTVTAFALGAIFTFIARIDEDSIGEVTETKIEVKAQLGEEVIIRSPLKGNLKDIAEVNDKVFSEGIMGKGVAIEPSEGKVIAPFDGKVEALFNTKHAIGLKSDNGVEMLIQIGIDTVNLEGKYFTAYVENGQEIKAGDLLVEFDIDAIKNEGYDIITPVLITNVEEYKNIFPITASNMVENDEIIKVIK